MARNSLSANGMLIKTVIGRSKEGRLVAQLALEAPILEADAQALASMVGRSVSLLLTAAQARLVGDETQMTMGYDGEELEA